MAEIGKPPAGGARGPLMRPDVAPARRRGPRAQVRGSHPETAEPNGHAPDTDHDVMEPSHANGGHPAPPGRRPPALPESPLGPRQGVSARPQALGLGRPGTFAGLTPRPQATLGRAEADPAVALATAQRLAEAAAKKPKPAEVAAQRSALQDSAQRNRLEHIDHEVENHNNDVRAQVQDARAQAARKLKKLASPQVSERRAQEAQTLNKAAARGHMTDDEGALADAIDADDVARNHRR